MLMSKAFAGIAGRFGAAVATGFLGHLAILLGAAAVLAAAFSTTFGAASLQPSPWLLAAPLSTAAAMWTRQSLRARREDLAIATSGAALGRVALPAVAVALAVQCALCVPGELRGRALPRRGGLQPLVAVDGSLFVALSDQVYVWSADRERPERADAAAAGTLALPAGFVVEPYDRRRLRRQLFAIGTPLAPLAHPLDPGAARWLWLAAGLAGVWIALGSERHRALAPVPLGLAATALL